MNIELTDTECENVTVALLLAVKSPTTDASVMRALMILRDKFEAAKIVEQPEQKADNPLSEPETPSS